jgi:hypothetical protein
MSIGSAHAAGILHSLLFATSVTDAASASSHKRHASRALGRQGITERFSA